MPTRLNRGAAMLGAALVTLLAASALPQRAAAGTPSPSPSPSASPKLLDAMVIAAQRHPQSLRNSSRATTLIVRGDLERTGAQSVADALRYAPGVVVQQYGAPGSLATIALRGGSSAQTLVLIDGRPANEADTGLFDFSSLPAAGVERVELVEGGSSTLYGSAAVGGVINIITRQPGDGPRYEGYAQLGYQGSFDRGLSVWSGDPQRLSVRVDGSSLASRNGFDYPAFGQLESAGTRSNDDVTIKHTGVVFSDGFGLVRARLNFADDAAAVGAPGDVAFASAFARQQRVYERLALEVSAPLHGGDVSLQAFSDSKRLRFFDPSFAFDSHANGTSRGFSLRATRQLGSLHLLTAGWDSRGDVALFDPGFTGGTPNVARDAQSAWYLQDELHRPLARLRATAGLRTEHIAGNQSTTTPSLGILERLSDDVDVSGNYARAFRAPSLNERYYPFYGNPNLQPEYGATFDLRVRAETGMGAASVSWFGSDTNNLIVNVAIDSFGDVAPYNVNRARVRGLEGALQTRLAPRTNATLAYTDYLVASDLSPGHPQTRLQYRPSATAALTLTRQDRAWSYGGQGLFTGRRFADEANTKRMPAYLMLGAYVQRSLGSHAQVTLRGDNLSNDRLAEDQLGYPVIGARVTLRVTVQY